MPDVVILSLFVVGLLAAIVRVSWSGHRAAIAASAVLAGAIPVLLGETVAQVSLGRVLAWATQPESGKTLSLVLVSEALISGVIALRLLGREDRPLGIAALSAIPGPGLVLGMVGLQMILFDRISGVDFSSLSWGLALSVALCLGGLAWLGSRLSSPERLAELSVRLAAFQLLLGTALPLLLKPPQSQRGPGSIDLNAAVLAPVLLFTIAAIGFARHAVARLRSGRPPARGERIIT